MIDVQEKTMVTKTWENTDINIDTGTVLLSDILECYPVEKLVAQHLRIGDRMCAVGVAIQEGGGNWNDIGNVNPIFGLIDLSKPNTNEWVQPFVDATKAVYNIMQEKWGINCEQTNIIQKLFDNTYFRLQLAESNLTSHEALDAARQNVVQYLRSIGR